MELARLPLPVLDTPGQVATFYSYKGGVGRTMAVANLGLLLARGATAPVLLVDWDLETPGLPYYFPDAPEGPGLLELFEACSAWLSQHGDCDSRADAAQAQAVLDAVDWMQYVVRAHDSGPLYLLRAGRADASYAERVAQLDWQFLFDACPALFRCFAFQMARHFGHVLVDARAGRGDCAAICTTLLPTRLVLVFSPNRQQLSGLEELVLRATTYRRSHEDEQRPLLVYPLPSRIEADDHGHFALWRHGAADGLPGYQPVFEQVLAEAYGHHRLSLEQWFDHVGLPHGRHLACGEPLPVLAGGAMARGYGAFLDWFRAGACPWAPAPLAPLAPPRAQRPHNLQVEQELNGYWRVPAPGMQLAGQ